MRKLKWLFVPVFFISIVICHGQKTKSGINPPGINYSYFTQDPTKLIRKLPRSESKQFRSIGLDSIKPISSGYSAYQTKEGAIIYSALSETYTKKEEEWRSQVLPIKIDYFNNEGTLINTFDIQDHNKLFKKHGSQIEYFGYTDSDWQSIYDFDQGRPGDPQSYKATSYTNSTNIYNSLGSKNYIIQYQEFTFGEEDETPLLIDVTTDIVGLDSTGKVTMEMRDIRADIWNVVWSANRRYVAFSYGGDANGFQLFNYTFEIWDTKNKKRVLKEEFKGNGISINGVSESVPNLIGMSWSEITEEEKNWSNYIFIDCQNDIIYRGYESKGTGFPDGEEVYSDLNGIEILTKDGKKYFPYSSFMKSSKL